MSPADEYGNLYRELLDAIDLAENLWASTLEGTFTNMTLQFEATVDADQVLPEWADEPAEYHTNSDPTNLTFTGTTPTAQTPQPEVPSSDSHMVPIIHSEPFRCSWHLHDSGVQCHHLALDRAAFLRHLGGMHQVSGKQDAIITCQLYDHNTTSVCDTPILRGSFPRHADTHYRVRYYCQHCPAGKSFSRQDSWKKHITNTHVQAVIPEM